jgi:predicted nucleotidyltransferase
VKKIYITEDKASLLRLKENLECEVRPDEVDVSSLDRQDTLNPDLWKDGHTLDSRARLQLLDIADDFIEFLGIKYVKPIDICLTGSICNFNWSEFSDIDLHIVIDFDEVSDKTELVREYFDSKKNEWNNEHENLTIYGFNVELYVEDEGDETVSSGIYSLNKNEWLSKPSISDIKVNTESRKRKIKKAVADFTTRIDELYEAVQNCDDKVVLGELGDEIRNVMSMLRKARQDGLEKYGESSLGNLTYKCVRRMGYLDKIWKLETQIYDKKMSIN